MGMKHPDRARIAELERELAHERMLRITAQHTAEDLAKQVETQAATIRELSAERDELQSRVDEYNDADLHGEDN